MLSMAACMLLFIAISSVLNITLAARSLRETAVKENLPAMVGEIRNDILRQIGGPMAASLDVANNTYLHAWEGEGLPDSGLDAWRAYAARVKAVHKVDTVFWASPAQMKFMDQGGLSYMLEKGNPRDAWLDAFLAGGRRVELNLDPDPKTGVMKMYVNTRVELGDGQLAAAGLGMAVQGLADAVRAHRIGKTGHVFLARPNGSIILHRDPALADGEHRLQDLAGYSPALLKQLFGKTAFAHAVRDSERGELIVASSYIPELDVYAVAEVPESEILGDLVRNSAMVALAAGAIGGGLGLFLIFLVSRAIAAPVARAAAMLGEIADGHGDLTARMPVESGDEIGRLAGAFNRFVSSLNRTMSEVRDSTDAIAGASSEIAAGNQHLSSRTEAQASSLEETAAAMEELTSTVRQNADNARQANQLVLTASSQAEQGGRVVDAVVATMGTISEGSRKIADIISVIDGIAFQTNILALNAAVEAARAGEQGRGFAVVASEVRNLAQRSANAAREIKELIKHSVERVEEGARLVDDAGATMGGIVQAVQRVADLMGEIDSASREQSQGIGQVNQSIAAMDDVTQQNAALVEEAAAAAGALEDQAAKLAQVVGAFRLDTAGAAARPGRKQAAIAH
ncbi:HAMP domain-containing protein [Massilia sp. UMI-21]|nr:HAMP domain-containing protein [Massilia sp. UMI-21]